jgi:hypothetical protein
MLYIPGINSNCDEMNNSDGRRSYVSPPAISMGGDATAEGLPRLFRISVLYLMEHCSLRGEVALLLFRLSPFSGVSWIVVTFASALGLVLGLSAPSNSIFSNPLYILVVNVSLVVFFISGA